MSRIHEALRKAEAEAGRLNGDPDGGAIAVSSIATLEEDPAQDVAAMGSPEVDFRIRQTEWSPDAERMIFWRGDEETVSTEQFRRLRSRLYHLREQQPFKTVLVSSALPGEGKSFLASNLAHALSRRQNTRVALIDGDMRCPRLHESLGAPCEPGLSDLLRGSASQNEIVQAGPIPNLLFVPGGIRIDNSSELIANGKLAGLLAALSQQCDWVIVDSPALIPVSDGLLLAGICDAALMVVRSGVTPADAAERACQELKRRRLLGVALNWVTGKQAGGYYYSSYYDKNRTNGKAKGK